VLRSAALLTLSHSHFYDQTILWRHDRNSPPWIHGQQVAISCDDHVCPPVQRYFQELIVSGISAFADNLHDRNEFSHRDQLIEKIVALFSAAVAVKLGAEKDLGQLSRRVLRDARCLQPEGLFTTLSGEDSNQHDGAHEHVRVDPRCDRRCLSIFEDIGQNLLSHPTRFCLRADAVN
jgi:hypothetical protein